MYWHKQIESCLFSEVEDRLFPAATAFEERIQRFVFSMLVCDFPVFFPFDFQQSIGCGEY